jgi:hypothetical protein
MKTLIATLLLLTGCVVRAPWDAAPAPLDVYVSSDIAPEHAEGVADGASWWSDRVPGAIKGVTVTADEPPCGTVWVTYGNLVRPAETLPYDGCHTRLYVSRDRMPEGWMWRAVAHELGHALLGEDHDPTPGNVLEGACTPAEREAKDPKCYPGRGWSAEPSLTQDQIDRIKERMRG